MNKPARTSRSRAPSAPAKSGRPAGRIRSGMGGWQYEPWRETFYPADLRKGTELAYASRQVTAIEINSTFYRLQKPEVFAKWRDETPDDFMFSIKAPRYIVNRRALPGAADAIPKFIASGIATLQHKLGPILWQLAPTKLFDAGEIEAFLQLLPPDAEGITLRHALEVRHESFMTAEYLAIARKYRVATVFADTDKYPSFSDLTGDFVYARLMRTLSSQPTGYPKPALQKWAQRARTWAQGGEPDDLPRIDEPTSGKSTAREVFMFFISGAKERAPVAARHLISLLAAE